MNDSIWTAQIEMIGGGFLYRIFERGNSISFRELFANLESSDEFSFWYTQLLANAKLDAYFWEHPPLDNNTCERPAEFVLIESRQLVSLVADPAPFQHRLENMGQRDIAIFANLGGDALLLAPRPIAADDAYVHLATFVHQAPQEQIRNLWRHTGRLVRETLGNKPFWLSTSGLGVSWLHLRLDQYPKYYQHLAYKTVE